MNSEHHTNGISIGVGLRHAHYSDALTQPKPIDFIEVHAENFFADGGAACAVLEEVKDLYSISLHATTLGLGSGRKIPEQPLEKLNRLIERVDPILVSDHACFTWSSLHDRPVHAGDLLPVAFNHSNLDIMVENVIQVQERLSRQILVENLSAYVTPPGATMPEVEFLSELCQRAGCRLLLDLNNLVVNAFNAGDADPLASVANYIEQIPTQSVGEIHLAGCATPQQGEPMIDDHSQPVPEIVWDAYRLALRRFGAVSTLIEWDTALPTWDFLTHEAVKARDIATQELINEVA